MADLQAAYQPEARRSRPRRSGAAIPRGRQAAKFKPGNHATVAELVDAQDLGSCGATRGGSSPSGRIPRNARMTTRTARLLPGACLLGATLLACHSTAREDAFLGTRVPVARLDSVLRAADSLRLPLADARALLELAPDIGITATPPHDTMTIAQILSWARPEHARKQRAAAETTAAAAARRRETHQQLASPVASMAVDQTS